jgi:hypothetical protein
MSRSPPVATEGWRYRDRLADEMAKKPSAVQRRWLSTITSRHPVNPDLIGAGNIRIVNSPDAQPCADIYGVYRPSRSSRR